MQTETRSIASRLEYRGGAEGKLTGYAALYNSASQDLGGFTEVIAPGAFRNILRSNPDVLLLLNHDSNIVLGRTRAGTLQLSEDQRGLLVSAKLADTQLIRDMVISPMQRGEISQMSFAFRLNKDGQSWGAGENGLRKRTITDFASLTDVSVVTSPAYLDTSAVIRNMNEQESAARGVLDVYRKRLELAGGKRLISESAKQNLMRKKLQLLSL